jgi:tetratricopeptide (TPR) repeat protein
LPDLAELLAGAPTHERSLLELRATWRGLPEAHARVAARLRIFVLNWDPLGWIGGPFEPSATAIGDGDNFELVLYAPLAGAEALLGDLCRSVVDVGASQELLLTSGAYAQLAFAGKVPDLLSATGALSPIEPPEFEPAGDGWEPTGLGAIQDLVQAQFGPVDLDRSTVRLAAVAEPAPGCPACAGERFGFPAELAEAQAEMCAPHARQAAEITSERLARAEASNRDGWRAIVDASGALSAATYGLALDLLEQLEEAVDRIDPAIEELRADATAALELADQLRDSPAAFEAWAEDWPSRDWMLELPWMLDRRGLVDDALRVADAFAELDVDQRSVFASDAAVILAHAGRVTEARTRADANVRAYPEDIWTHVHAGDVHQALGDAERAEPAFRHAAALVAAHGRHEDASIVHERLAQLLSTIPGREGDAAEAALAAKRSRGAVHGQRIATSIGRNDPCPCGSGRKYKKCCGA